MRISDWSSDVCSSDVGALQEGRVDRSERLEALAGQPGAEGHRMLLGDADVEGALRKALSELVEAGAGRHRGGDRDDRFVVLGLGDEAGGEDVLDRKSKRLNSSH